MRKRKWKTKKSKLTGLPIELFRWPEWIPELLPLADIAMHEDPIAATQEAAATLTKRLGFTFDGSATSMRRLLASPEVDELRIIAKPFLDGFAEVLFRAVQGPPDQLAEDVERTIVLAASVLSNIHGKTTTRTRALHLWLRFGNQLREEDHDTVHGYLAGDNSKASRIRVLWRMMLMGSQSKPDEEWAARLYHWGIERTMCMPTEYELPDRPPWPIPALEPIAAEIDALYRRFVSIHAPMTLAKGDVAIAIAERIRQLTNRIKARTHHNDGLTAEILMRCLADSAVQLCWLARKNDDTFFEKFKERSYGRQRERIERVQHAMPASGEISEMIKSGLNRSYAELSAAYGTWPELLDVVYGPWSDLTSGKMLADIGGDNSSMAQPWRSGSDAVHGSWRNLRKYSVERCRNALHLGHSIAVECDSKSAGVVPVLAALRNSIEALYALFEIFPPPPDLDYGKRLDKASYDLAEWIKSHLTEHGYRWFDESAAGDPMPEEV